MKGGNLKVEDRARKIAAANGMIYNDLDENGKEKYRRMAMSDMS